MCFLSLFPYIYIYVVGPYMYIIRSYIRNTLKFAGLLTITLHYQFHTAGMYTVESLQVVIKTDITYRSGHYVDIWKQFNR